MISCGFMGYNQNPLRFRWVSAIFCGNFDNTWGYWCKIDVLWCTGSKSGIVTFWTAFMAKWYQANEILLVDCAVMLILYVYLIIYLYLYIYMSMKNWYQGNTTFSPMSSWWFGWVHWHNHLKCPSKWIENQQNFSTQYSNRFDWAMYCFHLGLPQNQGTDSTGWFLVQPLGLLDQGWCQHVPHVVTDLLI